MLESSSGTRPRTTARRSKPRSTSRCRRPPLLRAKRRNSTQTSLPWPPSMATQAPSTPSSCRPRSTANMSPTRISSGTSRWTIAGTLRHLCPPLHLQPLPARQSCVRRHRLLPNGILRRRQGAAPATLTVLAGRYLPVNPGS